MDTEIQNNFNLQSHQLEMVLSNGGVGNRSAFELLYKPLFSRTVIFAILD